MTPPGAGSAILQCDNEVQFDRYSCRHAFMRGFPLARADDRQAVIDRADCGDWLITALELPSLPAELARSWQLPCRPRWRI
jgi:hypothetical protein